MQCSAVQRSLMQCSAVQWSFMQCSAVQCSAMRCSALQYCTVKGIAVQCSKVAPAVRGLLEWQQQFIYWGGLFIWLGVTEKSFLETHNNYLMKILCVKSDINASMQIHICIDIYYQVIMIIVNITKPRLKIIIFTFSSWTHSANFLLDTKMNPTMPTIPKWKT